MLKVGLEGSSLCLCTIKERGAIPVSWIHHCHKTLRGLLEVTCVWGWVESRVGGGERVSGAALNDAQRAERVEKRE